LTPRKLTPRQIREFLPKMPFNSLVGVRLTRTHADGVTIECDVRKELYNGAGVVHGGVTATLVDAAVGISLNRHFGGARPITTVELKINYFKPVSEGRIYARAYLQRIGSSICVGRVDLNDSKKNLIGSALVTYMILPQRA
jgi:uncharacterized protein (TIGR00369 family)